MALRNYTLRKLTGPALVAVLATWGAADSAQARYAEIDSVFLNHRAAEVEALGDSLLAQTTERYEVYGHIVQILDVRRRAIEELASRMRITSFDAIETQDEYGETVLFVVGRLLERARDLPHLPVAHEDLETFRHEMGVVPDLGYAPAPYLVAAALDAIAEKAQTIQAETDLPPEVVHSLTLDIFADAYRQLTTDQTDDITATRVESFRQDTVVERIRCPKDGSNYRVRQIKNKLFADESFATIWELRCNICYEDRQIWFPHVYLERLMKADKDQNLRHIPEKIDPHGGLEP